MRKENLKIIITGHLDHGKSTLIGRLLLDTGSLSNEKMSEVKEISRRLGKESSLAFVCDQLKEEREQDMTIDTTQTFFKTPKRRYCIIDSPGHLEFIKNMLSGATQAEAAVLIIDVKAGIEEQTRRHAYLLSMLGIKNIAVVFNKMDLAGYSRERFEEVKADLLLCFFRLNIKPIFLLPASARLGENISKKSKRMLWYKGPCLLKALDSIRTQKATKHLPLRLPIQDIYEIKSEKTAVGKVISGTIKKGQEVELCSPLKHSRVSAIRIFGKKTKKASRGENIGVILDDPLLAERGMVISDSQNPCDASQYFKAQLFWISGEPLELNKQYTLKCATQEATCIAEKIEQRINSSSLTLLEAGARQLLSNEAGVVFFRTEKLIVLEKFEDIEELGRFVVEKDRVLCGAGIVKETLG